MAGLKRIILIDTHLPGVVELKLDGHTNICGTNASGKTTLQRLIPVFYGEYPSRVVPATRDSFERWYLPPRDHNFYTPGRGELVIQQASHLEWSRAIAFWHLMKLHRRLPEAC